MRNPMALFKKKKRPRVCVIGLDGVPHGLLSDLARRGVMPAVGRLIDSGHLHKMKASLPEISAVSWTDFMTGAEFRDPRHLRVYGFQADVLQPRYPEFFRRAIGNVLG